MARSRIRRMATACCVAALCGGAGARPAGAADLSGSVLLSTSSTDTGSVETDTVDQQYHLSLYQRFTPYLALRLGAQYLDLGTQVAGDGELFQRSREPSLALLYNRGDVSGRFQVFDRVADGSQDVDQFEVRSYLGALSWRTSWGPILSLQVRDESNVADVAVFGRDNTSRTLTGSALYNRRLWSAGYTYTAFELDNHLTGLGFEQSRHELRLDASRELFDDRLRLGLSSWLSRQDRHQHVPAGTEIAQPVLATQGLAAIDTNPDVGALDPAPGLIDGELRTPALPGVAGQIGGANTFRNLGVDLGFALPATRLEVTVDAPSGAAVVWEAWHSADNLLWQRIGGVTSEWDPTLLRYTLRFPETTDRFFKAVNLSANPAPDVAVTELRALQDVAGLASADGSADLYRGDLSAVYQATERVRASVGVGASRDENLTSQVVQRRFDEVHARTALDVDLPHDLHARAGYQYLDLEERVEPVLLRTEEVYDASLSWRPLETFEAALLYHRRDESDDGALVRSIESARLRVVSELLPDLSLTTELESSQVDDPLGGQDRDGWALRQYLNARPRPEWSVTGGWSVVRYRDPRGEPVLDRKALDLQTTWLATAYLSLTGAWDYMVDLDRTSLRQSYALSWSPGPKLTAALAWESFGDDELRHTTNESATVTYRLTQRFSLFGTFSRSSFDETGGEGTQATTLRTGVALFF